MKTRAALLFSQPGKWEVTDVDLDEPKDHEVLVQHRGRRAVPLRRPPRHRRRPVRPLPLLRRPRRRRHRGEGRVGGPQRRARRPRGAVVRPELRPVPVVLPGAAEPLRQRRHDADGLPARRHVPDARQRRGRRPDGHDRRRSPSTRSSSEWGCIKIDDDIPFAEAALVGCGVPTGWGSAVAACGVKPGDVHIVMGVGGIGINAVQGARHAGASVIIAVDPVPFKRDTALALGATDAFETIEEAGDFARSITDGQGADSAIVTVGVVKGEHVGQAFDTVRKAGTLAVTGVSNIAEAASRSACSSCPCSRSASRACSSAASRRRRTSPAFVKLYKAGQLKLDRARHPEVHPRRDQRGLRGHARRPQHPGRHPLRVTLKLDKLQLLRRR